MCFEHATHHELEHGLPGLDQAAHCVVPAVDAEVTGVKPVWSHRDESLGGETLLLSECTTRGLLAGLIRVKGENDLARSGRVAVVDVPNHATDDLNVVKPKRGSTGRDGRRDPG